MSSSTTLAAFARIEAALPANPPEALAGIDPASLCKTYNGIEADIKDVLPIIALIPVYGGAISAALTTLMKIADALCPVGGG
jgi:hypothetical protein